MFMSMCNKALNPKFLLLHIYSYMYTCFNILILGGYFNMYKFYPTVLSLVLVALDSSEYIYQSRSRDEDWFGGVCRGSCVDDCR